MERRRFFKQSAAALAAIAITPNVLAVDSTPGINAHSAQYGNISEWLAAEYSNLQPGVYKFVGEFFNETITIGY